ncbi:hypothetical protein JHK87_022600 [Glycine soja]|nr:hypothetical protein JHK87_022600 [Glycine soja]
MLTIIHSTTALSPYNPCLDPSSPYYIHPSDNPSSISATPTLIGSNYHSWSHSIKMALTSKNKMGFLNATIPVLATTDPIYLSWECYNTLIISWLLNSLSPSIVQSVIFLDRAIDIYMDLQERFSQSDFYGIRQGSRSVSDYYTALKSLWEELDNFRPFHVSTCSTKLYHQQDFIIRILKGLDDHFSVVHSQILLMDPLPSSNRVFSMVAQQERQHSSSSTIDEPNAFINAGQSTYGKGHDIRGPSGPAGVNARTNGSNKKCIYCGCTEHTVDVCYSKHGFHNRDNSPSSAVVNSATQEVDSHIHSSISQDNDSNELGFSLTRAQYQGLQVSKSNSNDSPEMFFGTHFSFCTTTNPSSLSNAHTTHSFSNCTPWIIDSGAIDHITCSFDNFLNFSKIQPVRIHLPNGSIVFAHISGNVQLSPHFIIHDVLYVPNFKFNLISISKLLSSLKYTLTFSNSHCQI